MSQETHSNAEIITSSVAVGTGAGLAVVAAIGIIEGSKLAGRGAVWTAHAVRDGFSHLAERRRERKAEKSSSKKRKR